MITDGQQTVDKGPYTPLKAASEGLQAQGVKIYALGIGKAVNLAELTAIASNFKYVFRADSFKDLEVEVEGIKQEICEGNFYLLLYVTIKNESTAKSNVQVNLLHNHSWLF